MCCVVMMSLTYLLPRACTCPLSCPGLPGTSGSLNNTRTRMSHTLGRYKIWRLGDPRKRPIAPRHRPAQCMGSLPVVYGSARHLLTDSRTAKIGPRVREGGFLSRERPKSRLWRPREAAIGAGNLPVPLVAAAPGCVGSNATLAQPNPASTRRARGWEDEDIQQSGGRR